VATRAQVHLQFQPPSSAISDTSTKVFDGPTFRGRFRQAKAWRNKALKNPYVEISLDAPAGLTEPAIP